MKTTLLSLVGLVALTSVPAFADVGQVKALVFSSQSQLKIDGTEARGGSAAGTELADDDQDKINSIGGGAAFEWRVANPLYLGAGVGYINYDGDSDQAGYSDLNANVYGTLDVWANDSTAIYGKAGLSYHFLSLEDLSESGVKIQGDETNLGNYDLGAGARFKLNYATNLGLEYRFSDTFARSDLDLDLEGAGLAYNGLTYKDVGVESQEVQVSLGFVF